ncbi:MAG: M23 family metallopeptidase [Lachnospiraceae bacterium]|nr:M23 family metallopeptidase [Lachnospiraceae bacterium]MCI9133745.1 M23 family metallopeptidase [Lachnospiraceae bacterium]
MKREKILWTGICLELLVLSVFFGSLMREKSWEQEQRLASSQEVTAEKDYIKWVDFNVTAEALAKSYAYDVDTWEQPVHLCWIQLLAYAAARTGGDFSRQSQAETYLEEAAQALLDGKTMEELTGELKYYDYYLEAYTAVLGGLVGEYQAETEEGWENRYGLKAYLPIAKNFPYSDYDDFGASRSYGYRRPHLGHDMMGQVGTPIVAVESGYVEALGWNQYGGWRIGIRSFDKKRYYYYAHLRQGFPYALDLEEGSVVQAGDVIGYMGHTGYSTKEDVNNIEITHLHFGIQLIFDESQKDGNQEIWINPYELVRFLYRNRCETARNDETKEWKRIYEIRDPACEAFEQAQNDKSDP